MIGMHQLIGCLLLVAVGHFSLTDAATCQIVEIFSGTCEVKCTLYGIGGNTQDPGQAAGQFLTSVYDDWKDVCIDKWILEIGQSAFPGARLKANWLSGGPLPPITSLVLHTVGITAIDTAAFDAPHFSSNLKLLAIYNNPGLSSLNTGMTQGLTNLESFQWVGNGELSHADSLALAPFYRSLQVFQINDCGFSSAEVVANMTGFCQSAGLLTTLKSLDFGYNPGPGLQTIGARHFSKLGSVLSLYLWSSAIEFVENSEVFDPIAKSIQTLDLANNLLRGLPEKTFDTIIAENKLRFTIALEGNPWHCDCHLEWLQTAIRFSLGNIFLADNPVCSSPPSQAGKLLIDADMKTECGPAVGDKPLDVNC